MRALWLGLGLVVALHTTGCGLYWGWLPWMDRPPTRADESHGVQLVGNEAVVEFHERANTFYARLAKRRFNTLATYRDERLREYFRTDAAFSDYYADLAQTLQDFHFEKNRPVRLAVRDFVFEGPGRAKVTVRIEGANGLPLRPGKTVYLRQDRWERLEERWWIIPGKL